MGIERFGKFLAPTLAASALLYSTGCAETRHYVRDYFHEQRVDEREFDKEWQEHARKLLENRDYGGAWP